ncbi:MAG: phospholipase D-like domain-containing protein [Sterolibacterium sp.]|nr:phospholipase D-like domain-containing protein [Sterolibacterium sp.]
MPISELTAFEKAAVAGLSSKAGLAAALLAIWPELPEGSHQTAQSITAMAQLGVTEERGAKDVLDKAAQLGLLDSEKAGYVARRHGHAVFRRLSFALRAIDHYLTNAHQDATTAQIVLTKPPRPSVLEDELAQLGWRTADVEPTEHAFHSMVQSARHRVVVMTPFFDVKGAVWLKELFSQVGKGVSRLLILRSLEDPSRADYPIGYDAVASWLVSERVDVYNYSIPRPEGYGRETFHAKVVLCDVDVAYVGSSNLTSASLEHSMEMGISVKGKAAADVAIVIEAVLRAAKRIT